jgi:ribosomal protein L11 methyltransferase
VWQVSISTIAEAEEAVACVLERQFAQPPSIYCDEDTGRRTVTLYPSRLGQSSRMLRASLRAALRQIAGCGLHFGTTKIIVKRLPRQNWAESWKRHFKPIEIGDSLLIKPGWSKRPPRRGQAVVVLDPGLSFGTGHHPTTLFCLEQLARCRRAGTRQSFLDIGTGSGILAIAAAKLDYAPVEAFDNDPAAVRVCRENVKKNHLAARVRPRRQDLAALQPGGRRYDLICANLMFDLLIREAGRIGGRLKPDGKLIVAGLLREQFKEVEKTLRGFNLTLKVAKSDKQWRSGQFAFGNDGMG